METMMGRIEQLTTEPTFGTWNPHRTSETAELKTLVQQMKGLVADMAGLVRKIEAQPLAEDKLRAIFREEVEKLIHEINHCNQKCGTKKAATPDKSQTVADNLYSPETLEAIKKTAEHVCCPEAAMWADIKSAIDEAARKSTAAALMKQTLDALLPTKYDDTLTEIVQRAVDEELQKKRAKGD